MSRHSFVAISLSIALISGCGASALPSAENSNDKAETVDGAELFRQGEEAANRGDTVRAEQYLSMAIERGYSEKKVLPIMLRVCLSSSRLRAALNHAEPYLRAHPNDQDLRYLVATIHLGLGQLDEVRFELNHILRIDPNHPKAHYLLGVLESAINSEQATAHFRRYLEVAPTGEHAIEVKSRLTDLAVRKDLSRTSELINVDVPPIAPADELPGGGERWFCENSTAARSEP
jgi:tetratricopeptide (TPR) repeat protein